jgi:hypothetical protein
LVRSQRKVWILPSIGGLINQVEIDAVLSSEASFTISFMETLEFGLKGFHPKEYLLFGNARSRKPPE